MKTYLNWQGYEPGCIFLANHKKSTTLARYSILSIFNLSYRQAS